MLRTALKFGKMAIPVVILGAGTWVGCYLNSMLPLLAVLGSVLTMGLSVFVFLVPFLVASMVNGV
jgi:hypothetical protein